MLPLKQTSIDPIQKEILRALNLSKRLMRFSELQPEGVENDLFNYHLQFLVKKDYVVKSNDGYDISQSGKEFFSNLGLKGEEFKLFKYSIAAFLVKDGKILMQKRGRHPFHNDVMTVSGKILWGEKVIDAAKRKVLEETGLTAEFKHIGVLRKIRRDNQNRVIEDTIYNICFATDCSGELMEVTEYGENFWTDRNNYKDLTKNNIDKGKYDLEVYDRVALGNTEFFMFEQDMVIKGY